MKKLVSYILLMIAIAITLCAIILTSGCVCTYVKTEKWSCTRFAFGLNATMPKLTMSKDGSVHLEGYNGQVDPETIDAIGKAVAAYLKVAP